MSLLGLSVRQFVGPLSSFLFSVLSLALMQVGVHSFGPLSILQGADLVLTAWLSCGWVSILLDHSLSREALTPLTLCMAGPSVEWHSHLFVFGTLTKQ